MNVRRVQQGYGLHGKTTLVGTRKILFENQKQGDLIMVFYLQVQGKVPKKHQQTDNQYSIFFIQNLITEIYLESTRRRITARNSIELASSVDRYYQDSLEFNCSAIIQYLYLLTIVVAIFQIKITQPSVMCPQVESREICQGYIY